MLAETKDTDLVLGIGNGCFHTTSRKEMAHLMGFHEKQSLLSRFLGKEKGADFSVPFHRKISYRCNYFLIHKFSRIQDIILP